MNKFLVVFLILLSSCALKEVDTVDYQIKTEPTNVIESIDLQNKIIIKQQADAINQEKDSLHIERQKYFNKELEDRLY